MKWIMSLGLTITINKRLKMIKIFTTAVLISTLSISINAAQTELHGSEWQLTNINKKVSLRGSAISNNTLWVSGSNNSVHISNDNGQTWLDRSVKSDIKTGFRDIHVFDDKTAIVMGIGNGSQSTLFKTVDAGITWQKLYQNKDETGFFDSIAFWDAKNGLLLGDPVDGYYVIKRTTDGGKTWRRISKNKLPEKLENEAAFAASGNTLIVGKNGLAWFATGGLSASVYSSLDFGQTWQRAAVPLHQKTKTSGAYALALNNKDQLFVMGGDYLKRDGKYKNLALLNNKTWLNLDNKDNGLRTALACVKSTCITTGKLSSDISYDDGLTWQALNSNIKHGFYTLASNHKIILAAGADGTIGVMHIDK